MEDKNYVATVGRIIKGGKHGPYAVSHVEALGPVTFALDPTVWRESEWPTEGTIVILQDVRRKTGGWRAQSARFMRPEDTQRTQTERRKQ